MLKVRTNYSMFPIKRTVFFTSVTVHKILRYWNAHLIFKALGILGFPSFQSLDLIEYEPICSAFLNKLMTVMKNRKQAMMKAQEDRNKPKSQIQIQSRLRREKSWRVDVVMINEAFQVQSFYNRNLVDLCIFSGLFLRYSTSFTLTYCKVVSSNMSCLEAHAGFFRLLLWSEFLIFMYSDNLTIS